VEVTPSSAVGGYLFAELYDVFPDGRTVRVGWGAIDLRHHAGGNTEGQPLAPGQPVVAMMELEPMDAIFADGHRLRLVLHREGVEDILPTPTREPVQLGLGPASVLRLPEVARPSILPTYTPPGLPQA
jgi:predicted acyl esterase